MSGSSSYRFGVLARIVRHMKARHQEGDDHPLTLDEVLDETNQLDVGNKVKQVYRYNCNATLASMCNTHIGVYVLCIYLL